MIDWRPPEEATGGTHRTDDRKSDAAGGGATNDTDGEEAKDTERKRANCRGQGTRENQGRGGKGKMEERERQGGDQNHHRTVKIAN